MALALVSTPETASPGKMVNQVASRQTLDALIPASQAQAEGWEGTNVAQATPVGYQANYQRVEANIPSAGDTRAPNRPSLRRIAMFFHDTNRLMRPQNKGDHIVIGVQVGVKGRQLPFTPSASTKRSFPSPWGKNVVIGGGGNNG